MKRLFSLPESFVLFSLLISCGSPPSPQTPKHRADPLLGLAEAYLAYAKSPISVEVEIRCRDESLKLQLLSRLKRELLALGDVKITETKPELQVVLTALRINSETFYSYILLTPFKSDFDPRTSPKTYEGMLFQYRDEKFFGAPRCYVWVTERLS